MAVATQLPKQFPYPLIFYGHVHVRRSDRDIRVADRISNLGQCASTGQSAGNKRVPTVMDGERGRAFDA